MNSLWLIIVAVAAFAVAYRFYGAFMAAKVAVLNDRRVTPAHRMRDNVDYHPTSRLVLFGVHFAAIAGAGPLIGPVLAAQWGYLPGFTWIIVGACLAGAVHDFVLLWASVRSKGLSLPKIAQNNIGKFSGIATSFATLFIVISVLASMAIVVVNALSESSWGMFTIIVTIPAALITGFWMYWIRPGRIAEASLIGVSLVLLGVFLGAPFSTSQAGHWLLFDKRTLSYILPVYAFIASVLPVWVLMCPRDYLSSYMKIGVIIVLAVGIVVAHPTLNMPATTCFIGGGGPIISGAIWPFVCIVIMCGAPALIAACALEPGDYFAINIAQDKDKPAQVTAYVKFVETSGPQFVGGLEPKELAMLEKQTNENLRGRVGGAVTLAVGMAKVLANACAKGANLDRLIAYWYHFVIMFEALFILTLLETGTRVGRFVFQEITAQVMPSLAPGGKAKWGANIALSALTCGAWGYLLLNNNINTLWRMLGIANQLLAAIALAVGTTFILNRAPKRIYALCTGIPFVFVLITVATASVQSIKGWWKQAAVETDNQKLQLQLMCLLGTIMLALTCMITVDAIRKWRLILLSPVVPQPTFEEEAYAESGAK
ncbi:MAG: carbon starvation protein A [Candidatus Sumerlaeota bacterium]|nr:carbon starvation protein A [Candidatus Sumerlaeota bacterium]